MYFFIFTDVKTNRTAKFKCLSCEKGKKRNDVVIFAREQYDFENEVIKSTFLKYSTILSDSLCYVCKVCYYALRKEKGREPKMPQKKSAQDEHIYLCTCCHQEKISSCQAVRFKEKNYDFGNKVVSECLGKEFRHQNCGIEYICKSCHNCLCFKVGIFPKMPKQAVAREGRVCHECKNNGNEQNRIKSHSGSYLEMNAGI